MVLTIYTTDNCSHCQATIKWLEDRGIDYQIVNLSNYESEE